MNPTPPFAVQRIDPVVLRVADLDRSILFYREVLGCEVVTDPDSNEIELKGAPQ